MEVGFGRLADKPDSQMGSIVDDEIEEFSTQEDQHCCSKIRVFWENI